MGMAESLEIVVRNEVSGSIETNINDVEAFVLERIKDYEPEKYVGDAALAKTDRAELNKAKKAVADTRKAVLARVTKPFLEFEKKCKDLESLIGDASSKLDGIVKWKEQEERDSKKALIEVEWQSRNFTLFPLDKVLDQRWLNKTFKMSDVAKEITAIIERTYSDLKVIEGAYEGSVAETLKARYLVSLDLSEAMSYGGTLMKNLEAAKAEKEGRAERETAARVAEQRIEIAKESKALSSAEKVSALVEEASGISAERSGSEYVLTVTVSDRQLLGIKNYLTMQGIAYRCEELEF